MPYRILQWTAAAVLLLLVGMLGVVSTYTKTVNCLPGEHKLATLPDGSTVELNAGSELAYYPLKWKLERKLKFEGEAYFNVKKGNKFYVVSENGKERSINLDIVIKNNTVLKKQVINYLSKNLPYVFIPKKINIVKKIERSEIGSKIIRQVGGINDS